MSQPRGHVLGAREHEHLAQVAAAHEVRQQLPLVVGVDEVDDLLDRLRRRHLGLDVDLLRVVQEGPRERPHLGVEGGAEQQVLALGRAAAR